MKILVDLKVLLDLFQHRDPHYADSAKLLDAVIRNVLAGVIPAHSITTLSYIITKHGSVEQARESVEWMVDHFSIEPATHRTFCAALDLAFPDYDDAVVHGLADSARCQCIITRNTKDFAQATIPVLTPTQFLDQLESQI